MVFPQGYWNKGMTPEEMKKQGNKINVAITNLIRENERFFKEMGKLAKRVKTLEQCYPNEEELKRLKVGGTD